MAVRALWCKNHPPEFVLFEDIGFERLQDKEDKKV
jgi:hypothetical protein